MANSCQIGVLDNHLNQIECGHTEATLHVRGVNKSRKIIDFSHWNSTNFYDNFKGNFMRRKKLS